MQVSAQSWHGLAPRDDDRHRIAATADGGIWLLRTPHPEPATGLAGRRPVLDTNGTRRTHGQAGCQPAREPGTTHGPAT